MYDFEKIKSFLIKETSFAVNPGNTLQTFNFLNLNELIDTFLLLLQYKSQEKELEETGNKILNAISLFSNDIIEVERLNIGIENLATAFESYLKIIAELKYSKNEPVKFYGDSVNYLGLISTTMGNLLLGKVAKVSPTNNSVPQIYAPIVTFSYSLTTIEDNIYENVRKLRNEVHTTPSRSLVDVFKHFRDCISAYYFALQENLVIIRPYIDSIFTFLEASKVTYEKQNNLFINIDSGEYRLVDDIDWTELDVVEKIENESDSVEIVKEPVLTTLETNSCLWLIGEPGSGKTTSLQAYLYYETKKILASGYINSERIPVIIEARLFNSATTLLEFVSNTTKISKNIISNLLLNDNLKFLIDGINELPHEIQISIQKDVKALRLEYEDMSTIISSRRYGFSKILDFKVYELLPLTIDQIENYIKKYIKDSNKSQRIFNQILQADELIMDFARNPMLLKMLIQVGVKEQIQSNFGLLFQKFINEIFVREKEKILQIDEIIKEKALSDVAYKMKDKSYRAIDQDEMLGSFSETIRKWNENVSPIKLLTQLLDNRLLIINENKQISFFHELVLEYFASLKLKEIFPVQPTIVIDLSKNSEWGESIIMMACIVSNPDILISQIYKLNIILSARCISAGSKVSATIMDNILDECSSRLQNEEDVEHETITALLELSTPDSFRLVVKHLAEKRYSFTIALNRCQRPEIIATKLLDFGLTGKNRIRQCLKVFTGKPNTSSFINSPAVSNAQILLMSNELEYEDLFLIKELGISNNAADVVKQRTLYVINNSEIRSRIFTQACMLLAQIKPEQIVFENIKVKLQIEVSKSNMGADLYRIHKIIKSLPKIIDISQVVNILLPKLKEKKYYRLLLLYIETISPPHINGVSQEQFILSVAQDMALNKKTTTILEYYIKYPLLISKEVLIQGFNNCLQIPLSGESFKYISEVYSFLTAGQKNEIVEAILNMNNSQLKTSSVLKWINKLNLLPYFNNIAIITKSFGHFGFAQKIGSSDIYHFKIKKGDIKPGKKTRFLRIKKTKKSLISNGTNKKPIYPSITECEFF